MNANNAQSSSNVVLKMVYSQMQIVSKIKCGVRRKNLVQSNGVSALQTTALK